MLGIDTLNEHVFFYSFRLFLHFLQSKKYKKKKHDMKKCYKNKITASKSKHVHTSIPTCMFAYLGKRYKKRKKQKKKKKHKIFICVFPTSLISYPTQNTQLTLCFFFLLFFLPQQPCKWQHKSIVYSDRPINPANQPNNQPSK